MKILLSASACSSEWGSEPGVGWRWAETLARDHEVVVLTHKFFEAHLRTAPKNPSSNLSYRYISVPTFGLSERVYLNSRLYYVFWQFYCLLYCLRTGLHKDVDLIHHLTLGTFRFPSFLGLLGKPFFMGPLGGGERAPTRLGRSAPLRNRLIERVRICGILFSKFDPGVWLNCLSSTLIFCKTEESRTALPSIFWKKCRIRQEIGIQMPAQPDSPSPRRNEDSSRPLRALYAGKLIGLKGVHFAIEAVAEARRRGSDVTLTIAGEGPLQAWLVELARKAGVADSVEFLGHLDRASLLTAYADADVFVFPSLHDSSGNVVLEAMGAGLPVICLDLGGPKSFVSETTGFIVGASSMTVAQIPPAIANRLIELASDRPLLQRLSAAAVQRRTDFLWEKQVSRVYDDIAQYRSTGQSKVRT